MIIDKPGYYKTRDGRKIRIIAVAEDWAFGMYGDDKEPWHWRCNGQVDNEGVRNGDIIGPWTEPPKPLECYVNWYDNDPRNGFGYAYSTSEEALAEANPSATRTAVHMIEAKD